MQIHSKIQELSTALGIQKPRTEPKLGQTTVIAVEISRRDFECYRQVDRSGNLRLVVSSVAVVFAHDSNHGLASRKTLGHVMRVARAVGCRPWVKDEAVYADPAAERH